MSDTTAGHAPVPAPPAPAAEPDKLAQAQAQAQAQAGSTAAGSSVAAPEVALSAAPAPAPAAEPTPAAELAATVSEDRAAASEPVESVETAEPAESSESDALPEVSLEPFDEPVRQWLQSLSGAHVVSWEEAIEQAGGDAEFLNELLVDFYNESFSHMEKLRQEATQEHPRVVKDEAHAIKGAAANLMVYRIRWTAAAMEQPAKDVMTGRAEPVTLERQFPLLLPLLETEFQRFTELLQQMQLL